MGQSRQPVASDGQDEIFEQVSQVVLAVSSQLSVHDVLGKIVRAARSLAGARYAALGVPGEAGTFAEFVVDGLTAREQAAIGPLPRQHGMLAVMLREGKPLRLDDIRTDPRFWGWPAAHPELTDVLGVPIKEGDDTLGFIFAACKTVPGGFTERDERLVSLFAAHAAIALTNARLYERGRELSVLQERARLARDLHDAVSQKLFSVRAKARAAAVLVDRDPARAIEEIGSVAELAGQAHAELRAVIDGLAPPELATGGLAGSVRAYAVLAGTHTRYGRNSACGWTASARPAAGDRAVPGRAGGDQQRSTPLRGPSRHRLPDATPACRGARDQRRRHRLRAARPARGTRPGIDA